MRHMEEVKQHDLRYGYIFLTLSLLGLGDTTYLLAKTAQGVQDVCLFTEGCSTVLGSDYSIFLGVPTAGWGFLYYFLIFIFSVLFLVVRKMRILYALAGFTAVGFIVSLWLFYLQAFILDAFCEFCLLSATLSTIMFATGLVVLLHKHRKDFLSQFRNLFSS